MKPGYKTTEFWTSIITIGLTWASVFASFLPSDKAAFVTSIVAAFYAVSRGIAKSGPAL